MSITPTRIDDTQLRTFRRDGQVVLAVTTDSGSIEAVGDFRSVREAVGAVWTALQPTGEDRQDLNDRIWRTLISEVAGILADHFAGADVEGECEMTLPELIDSVRGLRITSSYFDNGWFPGYRVTPLDVGGDEIAGADAVAEEILDGLWSGDFTEDFRDLAGEFDDSWSCTVTHPDDRTYCG